MMRRVFKLPSRGTEKGRVVVFVPRWLPRAQTMVGLPYRVIPVVSTLQHAGFAVDLCHEVHECADDAAVQRRVPGAAAAAVWCAEMNPAEQMPGILSFADMARRVAPDVPRWLGGGFTSLLPADFDGDGLVELVRSEETGALASAIAARRGEVLAARQPFTVDALFAMDLACFVQPVPLLFGNDEPTLQLPTGLGCGKHCPFCFYEPTHLRLLPAAAVAAAMQHCRQRYGVHQFQLGELDFLASRPRALELAARLRAAGSPPRWFALASVQDLLAVGDGLRQLAAAGLTSLELGSESGSDDALRRLGKRFAVADVLEAQRRLLAAGVRPLHNILIGWPGETPADLRATRFLVARLKRMAAHTVLHFRLYQAIPSTPMGDLAMRDAGPLPRRLGDVLPWRQRQQRSMPWLSPLAERRARLWAEHLLPLAYGEDTGRRTSRRRWLESVARWRCRTGFTALRLEERVLGVEPARVTWLA